MNVHPISPELFPWVFWSPRNSKALSLMFRSIRSLVFALVLHKISSILRSHFTHGFLMMAQPCRSEICNSLHCSSHCNSLHCSSHSTVRPYLVIEPKLDCSVGGGLINRLLPEMKATYGAPMSSFCAKVLGSPMQLNWAELGSEDAPKLHFPLMAVCWCYVSWSGLPCF